MTVARRAQKRSEENGRSPGNRLIQLRYFPGANSVPVRGLRLYRALRLPPSTDWGGVAQLRRIISSSHCVKFSVVRHFQRKGDFLLLFFLILTVFFCKLTCDYGS